LNAPNQKVAKKQNNFVLQRLVLILRHLLSGCQISGFYCFNKIRF